MVYIAHALGANDEFIDFDSHEVPLHCALINPLRELKRAALKANFQLGVISGYRSFEHQLGIWNEKASGNRPLLDAEGKLLDVSDLSERDIVDAILLWSALPGASRHHWGSELDIVDASVVQRGYRAQLTVAECKQGGQFFEFHCWLDDYLQASDTGFFRPYTRIFDCGVSPEPWHLSYHPLAGQFEKVITVEALRAQIESSDLLLKKVVLEQLEPIFSNYIQRYFQSA